MERTDSSNEPAGVISGRAPWHKCFNLLRDQSQALAALGNNLYQQGKNRNAESVFRALIAFDRGAYFGYAGMGALTLAEGRLGEALVYLRKASELQPKDPTVRANLGETLLRQAKFDEAAAEFETALTLDPEEHDAGANRARAILQGMEVVLAEFRGTQAGHAAS